MRSGLIPAFFATWGGALRDGGRIARAIPWLVAAMVGVEVLQHVVELRLDMFSPDAATRAAAATAPIRMAFGWPKMAMVYVLGFFATRWAVTRDRRDTLRPSRRAVGRYTLVALFQAIVAAVIIYAMPLLDVAGIGKQGVLPLRLAAGLFQQLVEPLLFLWYVNAAMGTRGVGPVASARATGWLYFWALLLMFVTRLPFNVLHQVLNRSTAGLSTALLWPALILDAVVVGAMVVVLAAVQVRIARHVAGRGGRALLSD